MASAYPRIQGPGESDKRILFQLFIDDLHLYQEQIFIKFKKKKEYHRLYPTSLHKDIFCISLSHSSVFDGKNNMEYNYRIQDYKTKDIKRDYSYYRLQKDIINIFDTPDSFENKSLVNKVITLGLGNYQLLKQKNQQESLLNFIQPNSSLFFLNSLIEFIDDNRFFGLKMKYYQLSIQQLIIKLKSTTQYEEPIDLYLDFIEKVGRYQKEVRQQNIVELSNAMSRYYTFFEYKIADQARKRIRNKLVDLYSQYTNLEQRINILLNEYCLLNEDEAASLINKKEFNNEILYKPSYYLEFFSNYKSKYRDLFSEQIQRVIMLMVEKKKEGVMNILKQIKTNLQQFSQKELESIQLSIFDLKFSSQYEQREKIMQIILNISEIRQMFHISYYKARNYIIQMLEICKSNTNFSIKQYFDIINICIEYKIDINDYQNLVKEIINEYKDLNKFEQFISNLINSNPFTRLDKIILKSFEQETQMTFPHQIPGLFFKKNTYIKQINNLYEKQQMVIKELEKQFLGQKKDIQADKQDQIGQDDKQGKHQQNDHLKQNEMIVEEESEKQFLEQKKEIQDDKQDQIGQDDKQGQSQQNNHFKQNDIIVEEEQEKQFLEQNKEIQADKQDQISQDDKQRKHYQNDHLKQNEIIVVEDKQQSQSQWDQEIVTDKQIVLKQQEQLKNKPDAPEVKSQYDNNVQEQQEQRLKEEFFQFQKQILLNEQIIEQFSKQLVARLEMIVTDLPLKDLMYIENSPQFQMQERKEFEEIKRNRLQLKVRKENQSEEDFIKNYKTVQNYYGEQKIEILNYFDQLAVEKIQHFLENKFSYEILNSKFVNQFLEICDKTKQFYKKVEENINEIKKQIQKMNLTQKQIQSIFKQQYTIGILAQFNLQALEVKNQIDNLLKDSQNKFKDFLVFFYQFQEFYPQQYKQLQTHTMDNLLICQIQSFLYQFNLFEHIIKYYILFSDSKIFISILNELKEDYEERTKNQMNNLQDLNNLQPNPDIEQALFYQRTTNFAQLMVSLINNISQLCNIIFISKEGSITNLEEFNKIIQQSLGSFIKNVDQQQIQQQPLQQQNQAGQQDAQQQQMQQNQPEQYRMIFNNNTSINDLKRYCGDEVELFLDNLYKFHSIFKVKEDFKPAEENIKKCYMTMFYIDSSNLIKSFGQSINANWQSKDNEQLIQLLELVSKYKDMQQQPIKEMMQVQISRQIILDFEIILKQANIERNISLFIQSDNIIKHSKQNKEKNISYLDMRDFIGDNDHDLSSFLTVLNEFSQFFTELSDAQINIMQQGTSVLAAIIQINNAIEEQIKVPQRFLQWEEIIKNFHKIASIESSIDKKKNYLNLLKKMYTHGKTTIKIGNQKQEATFVIECDQKSYSEQEIREISSRVLIEKHSINAIFEQQDQRQKSNQLMVNLRDKTYINANLEKMNQEEKMEKFKRQLELAQDLKQIIQEMSDYGYFLFDKKEYFYNNQNGMYKNNMEQMAWQLKEFENQLQIWRKQIESITQEYPKFSFISYSFYPILNSFLSGDIYECDLDRSIFQITKFQIGAKSFETQNVIQAMQNYKTCTNQLKFIAQFITQNQYIPQIGGMMRIQEKRIKLIKYTNNKEAVYHLLSLNQKQQNMKSQYYLFCNEKTQIQDIQLFIQRYKYLTENEPLNFFMIISQPQINSHLNELVQLQNDQPYLNNLFILIEESCYDEKLCQIQQSSNIIVEQSTINQIKQQNHMKEIRKYAKFYCSTEPGSGKTNSVMAEGLINNQIPIRVPTNGDGDKSKFIEQLMTNSGNNEDVKRVYHIDLYETQNIELDFLLFEMIVLKGINHNSKKYKDLGSQSIFLIEINNTLKRQLELQLSIKDYFEIKNVVFDINNLCLKTLQQNHQSKALTTFKYLKGLNASQQQNDVLYFDTQNNLDSLNSINQINQQEFAQLLNQYIFQYLILNQITPNFWQISNFISLFGSEMEKMEQTIYLRIDIVERAQLRIGLRTTIINKSFDLCRNVSISCLKNTFKYNMDMSNEQLLTNIANSLTQFSSFMQDFVTFQEQEEACITSFFQNDQLTPKSIKDLYHQYQLQLLLFDQEQRPEILIHWLVMLCNKHIQHFYSSNKDISFNQIKNKDLRNEVEKIIIQKDNFFKIAMIFLRIRSLTPVIIMGEAGIGKTALIRLLSLIMEANFKTKIIHAGVTEDEIIQFIQQSEKELEKNPNKKTVLFFDEVNTNKLISGLFKEIIVDRHLKGRKLNQNIIPIAALNPYKLKSEDQQKIMQIQIHGGIKKELVDKIKGSDLEYTVNPIPDSMYSFSWNYGGLNPQDEKTYITQILIQMNQELFLNTKFQYKIELIKTTLSDLVFYSQEYLREVMGRISACSLRDVKRFVILLQNNINFLKVSTNLSNEKRLNIKDQDIEILAIYLSFYINYCVRIPLNEKRRDYLAEITKKFTTFSNKEMKEQFEKVEKFLINQIEVPLGIAKNYSLRQNTFILFICIINKIPVCLIGPPGSSKTLSLRQLIQSMQGVNSRSELFKKYQALMPLYYQGHIQSTSERIMEVFENAQKKQEAFNQKEVGHQNLSLVYIDEIGLAEISPHNPLKVLHATLEKPDIAVSCISNWPLDASKMNRMLTVYRQND